MGNLNPKPQPTPEITLLNAKDKIYKLIYQCRMYKFIYTGGMLNGKLHGKGQISCWEVANHYKITDITFHHGIIRGEIIMKYSDGGTYTGFAYITDDYHIYPHGMGKFEQKHEVLIGIFRDKLIDNGLVCYQDYCGEWNNYRKHGFGIDINEENPNFDCKLYKNDVAQHTVGSLRNKSAEELFGRPLPEEFVQRVNKLTKSKKKSKKSKRNSR